MTKEQTKKWILDQVNKDFEEVTEEYFESGAIRPTLDYYAELFEKYHKERLTLLGVNEVEFCTCGNPSGEGNIQMVNDEEMLFFCCDCGKQVQN